MQGWQHLLGQGELDGDRVDLRHAEQALRVAGAYQVARVDVANAHPASHRRADSGIRQLHLGVGDGCLVAFDGGLQLVDQCLLLVELLPGHAVIAAEQAVAPQVHCRHLDLRLALAEQGARLVELGLYGAVVEGGEQVALLDPLAFLDQNLGQYPLDLRAHLDAVQRQHRTDGAGVAGYVPLDDGYHPHRDGRLRAGGGGRLALGVPSSRCYQDEQYQGGKQGRAERTSHWCGHLGQWGGWSVIPSYSRRTGSAA